MTVPVKPANASARRLRWSTSGHQRNIGRNLRSLRSGFAIVPWVDRAAHPAVKSSCCAAARRRVARRSAAGRTASLVPHAAAWPVRRRAGWQAWVLVSFRGRPLVLWARWTRWTSWATRIDVSKRNAAGFRFETCSGRFARQIPSGRWPQCPFRPVKRRRSARTTIRHGACNTQG